MFPDKFTTDQDKKWFADSVVKIGNEAFGDTFGNVLREALDQLWYSFMSDIDYSEFENVDENDIPRSESAATTKGKKLDLVLFDDAMNHLARIARIIGMPRGHARDLLRQFSDTTSSRSNQAVTTA